MICRILGGSIVQFIDVDGEKCEKIKIFGG